MSSFFLTRCYICFSADFWAVLGLRTFLGFSSCNRLLCVVQALRWLGASVATVYEAQELDIQTPLPCSMWSLPRPRIDPMSPALAGGSTSATQGIPLLFPLCTGPNSQGAVRMQ